MIYEVIEYLKKIFITIFGAYHIETGNEFLTMLDIDVFDRIIFFVIGIALIFTVWSPKIIRTHKKRNKLIAEIIIHTVIVSTIVYNSLTEGTYLKGVMILLIYLLFELSIELFLEKPVLQEEGKEIKQNTKQ